MSQAQSTAQQKETPETVLLRQPLPKYNFQARKLPKEKPPAAASKSTTQGARVSPQVSQASDSGLGNSKSSTGLATPTYLPSADLVPSSGLDRKSAAVKPFSASLKSDADSAAPTDKGVLRPVSAVVAPNCRTGSQGKEVRLELGQTSKDKVPGAEPAAVGSMRGEALMTFLPGPAAVNLESNDIPVPDAALLAHAVEGLSMAEKLEKAEKEIKMLKSQLEIQLQVNAEIKRLLVASVGDDFERKVESLARDRAQLAMDLGDFTKKMTEDYENLDQISIQADMWRSKYLASRVMVEELASARAFYSSQFQDSQQAVQELLNERYELRTNLVQSYKCLQQVKEAFDPFNTQKSHSLPSTNVLDLAKNIKQLSDSVRFRLLPAHAGSHVMMPLEESWESTMTRAELLAYDQLSKQTVPPSFKHSMPNTTLTPSKPYERFHPLARHDNLTVNCCTKCKGEIKVA